MPCSNRPRESPREKGVIMRKGEAVHRALTSALVYVRDADREMKMAMTEARAAGLAGKLTGEIQAQLDLFEQIDNDVENLVLAFLAGVVV